MLDGDSYLKWEMYKRANTRRTSYAKRDLRKALEDAGCTIEEKGFFFHVTHPLPNEYTKEQALAIRTKVTNAIRRVHSRVARVFKGVIQLENRNEQ